MLRKGFTITPSMKEDMAALRQVTGKSNSALILEGLRLVRSHEDPHALVMKYSNYEDEELGLEDKTPECKRSGETRKVKMFSIHEVAEKILNDPIFRKTAKDGVKTNRSLVFEVGIILLAEKYLTNKPVISKPAHNLIGVATLDIISTLESRDLDKSHLKRLSNLLKKHGY